MQFIFFNAGGVVMYPLVLFMLAACTILFERIRMYRRIDSEIQQLSSSTLKPVVMRMIGLH